MRSAEGQPPRSEHPNDQCYVTREASHRQYLKLAPDAIPIGHTFSLLLFLVTNNGWSVPRHWSDAAVA